MNFFDIRVGITGLKNSEKAIISQLNIFETDFLHWMITIRNESITNKNTCLIVKIVIFGKIKLCDINSSWSH